MEKIEKLKQLAIEIKNVSKRNKNWALEYNISNVSRGIKEQASRGRTHFNFRLYEENILLLQIIKGLFEKRGFTVEQIREEGVDSSVEVKLKFSW